MPGLSNLKEKDSSVSTALERKSPVSLTTVCGSSSLLAQMTVVPALIVNELGANMKSLMTICGGSDEAALEGQLAAAAHRSATLSSVNELRKRREIMACFLLVADEIQASVVSVIASEFEGERVGKALELLLTGGQRLPRAIAVQRVRDGPARVVCR